MKMKNFLQPFGWKAWFVVGITCMGMVACSDHMYGYGSLFG